MTDSSDTNLTDNLSELVNICLSDPDSTVVGMLRWIAIRLDSFGCGLWEITENSDLSSDPPSGYLLTVGAYWQSGELFAMDDVPLSNSPSAQSIIEKRPVICNDLASEGGAKKDHPFWEKHGINKCCIVPITYPDNRWGALDVYREGSKDDFAQFDADVLLTIAAIVPALYLSMRERKLLGMHHAIEATLRNAETQFGLESPFPNFEGVFQDICQIVGKAFDTVETSIFTADDVELSEVTYKCEATTHEELGHLSEYRLPVDEGRLTGWALANRKPLLIQDLGNFQRDRDQILARYPGLKYASEESDKQRARTLLGLALDQDPPPLSFLVIPIFVGFHYAKGEPAPAALRCYMGKSAPFYFSEREAEQLEVVALQIGKWWEGWRTSHQLLGENKYLDQLVKDLERLNTIVLKEITVRNLEREEIIENALELSAHCIPGAKLNSVRLCYEKEHCLRYEALSPQAFTEYKSHGLNLPDSSLDDAHELAGVEVFRTGKSLEIDAKNSCARNVAIFKDVTFILIVPIGVGSDRQGVLDIRWRGKKKPTSFAKQTAELIGQQIGIFLKLSDLVEQERENLIETKRRQKQEANANEDLAHQLRNPIAEAGIRVDQLREWTSSVLGSDNKEESIDLSKKVDPIRGLLRRADRVAQQMKQLSEIAYGKAIVAKKQLLEPGKITKKLIELADDAQCLYEYKRLSFYVNRESFNHENLKWVSVDFALLEQMISNLIDNAGKYSLTATTIVISAGVSQTGKSYLAVSNNGIGFAKEEISQCIDRHWRSPRARLFEEGQGIGLWLVNRIMEAHDGELLIIDPNSEGLTEVRLVFTVNPNES
ncbi:MAG: GAF domain-containing protein [Opitutales bacterium]|nr:GAF domain-containing protein [Opitutales bacterium]